MNTTRGSAALPAAKSMMPGHRPGNPADNNWLTGLVTDLMAGLGPPEDGLRRACAEVRSRSFSRARLIRDPVP